MYFLYVDESGDCGLEKSPTRYFILSGLVVHELYWHETLNAIIDLRRRLRAHYGLKLREEIHAAHFIMDKKRVYGHIRKDLRLRILREVIDFQAGQPQISIINVLVDKQGKAPTFDVFQNAWTYLFQRFHNTITQRNFPGSRNARDHGLAVVDATDEKKLRAIVRRMRRYNPVPSIGGVGSRQILLDTVVEDPVHRNSLHSYFIQLCDVNSYLLKQQEDPNVFVRKKGGRHFFARLDPVLCKVARPSDPQGVVRV